MSNNEAKNQSSDISNLQQSFSKQQKKISALKELVRKSEVAHGKSTSTAQEKVKNIAQRLTLLKSKAKSRHGADVTHTKPIVEVETTIENTMPPEKTTSTSELPSLPNVVTTSTPNITPLKPQLDSDSIMSSMSSTGTSGSEKFQLLRQQMEQNKLRMAQRASSKQHLEQLVTQLKEKFDTTQQCLADTTELGKSMGDLSAITSYAPVTRERYKSATDLSLQPFSLEKERIKFLDNRCRLLEKQLEKERQLNSAHETSFTESTALEASTKQIKDLENKILELQRTVQDCETQIEGKSVENNKLTADNIRLQNENAEKDATITELQQKTKEHLRPNENIDSHELENERLRIEITDKLTRIEELEELNDILETARCDLIAKNNDCQEQLHQLQEELALSNEKLQQKDLELNEINAKYVILEQNLEKLESVKESRNVANIAETNTDSQVEAEMAKQIQELQDNKEQLTLENLQLKDSIKKSEKLEVSDESIAQKISALEATIESQREDLKSRLEAMNKQEEELMEKTIELNVLNANFKVLEEKLEASRKTKPLFSSTSGDNINNLELQSEIQQLKQKLDESNKAMIKLKLKCKQTEKQMEKMKKSSDLHSEVVRLGAVNVELEQKLADLEDEKGQWQWPDDEDTTASASGNVEVNKALITELEDKCKLQADTIRLLEQQKFEQSTKMDDMQQELQVLQLENKRQEHEEHARVKSELSEIHLEEQLETQTQEIQALKVKLLNSDNNLVELKARLDDLQTEKQAADKKLEQYIAENMDLLDKVEKLSKSSSSAESIEIVERLTQQEHAELDEYNKEYEQGHSVESMPAPNVVSELTQTEIGHELSESLAKLREESSELMNKIELFTTERREVLEKMESLTAENQELNQRIEELAREKTEMQANTELVENTKSKLEIKLQEVTKEKEILALQMAESSANNSLSHMSSLQTSSEVVAALDSAEGATLFDKCEKSLSKLNSELEAYHKADRNAKFNACKKLAKEAKNVLTQLSELLQKVKEASNAVETVTVVETVVAVTAPNGKALAEYEQLTKQNRELKTAVEELRLQLLEARETVHMSATDMPLDTNVPAISQTQSIEYEEKLQKYMEDLERYESQCSDLQSTVENLRQQLLELRTADQEKSNEINNLNEELETLRPLKQKQVLYDGQIQQLMNVKYELESKCMTYEGEMDILSTLVKEQKQQLIETFKEHEHEINLTLVKLQQKDEIITELRNELAELKQTAAAAGDQFDTEMQKECEKLRASLKISKALVTEQVDELANKQETIDTLNQQIIDLYKTIEENSDKVIEKEDEITSLHDVIEEKNKEAEGLQKDNNEQKLVVDKLLNELHTHKQNLPQLESELKRLEQANLNLTTKNKDLEQRNKEQLEKLKKYAVNLKKRALQCQEFEAKIKDFEKVALEQQQSEEMKANLTHELQELTTKNLLLNERINDLEVKLTETEALWKEVQEALQTKTLESLETLESNAQLEQQLKQVQHDLAEKIQETMQLQNALGAVQEQTVEAVNDMNLSSELSEKCAQVSRLEIELEKLHMELNNKVENIIQLRDELQVERSQVSDWGNDTLLDSAVNNDLKQELIEKTESLTQMTYTLNSVQAELLALREQTLEMQQAQADTQILIGEKNGLIEELQQKIRDGPRNTQSLHEEMQIKEHRLNEVTEELKAKALKFEKSKAVIKERNVQIQRLQAQVKDLQMKLSVQPEEHVESPLVHARLATSPAQHQTVSQQEYDALKASYDKLSDSYAKEKTNFEETITRLETLHDGIQAKLQEDMSYIETLEQENAKFKEKICKLEECVATFEERRASMERRSNLLDAQMKSRADEYEKTEDELIYRLNMLSEHDDIIAQRLLDTQEGNNELQERLDRLQLEFNELSTSNTRLEKEFQVYRESVTSKVEAENLNLREQLKAHEQEAQNIRDVYDGKLATKTAELDELECELGEQLQKMHAERRALVEDLERSRDECTEQKDEIVRLRETVNTLEQMKHELERETTWLRMQNENSQQDQYELQELRMQNMQDKTEIDNLRHQIETLIGNHEMELQGLRTQISQLDMLRMQVGQNQTDDQVFIETENKRLTDLLAEKQVVIENYQRQNLQLQMTAAAAAQSHQIPTDSLALTFGLSTQPQVQSSLSFPDANERNRFENELAQKMESITALQRDAGVLQTEVQELQEKNIELQRLLLEKEREIEQQQDLQVPQNDIIPAPPMYFASEQMTPSPFDDIIVVRNEHTLNASAMGPNRIRSEPSEHIIGEQPTIEDLQRNVSDLEKHAQDLESKLVVRNQRLVEYETQLREVQNHQHEFENLARDREQKLQRAQFEIGNMEHQHNLYKEAQHASQQNQQQLMVKLQQMERELTERDERIRECELKLQISEEHTADNRRTDLGAQFDSLRRIEELHNDLIATQEQLKLRDQELATLQKTLDKTQEKTMKSLENQILPDAVSQSIVTESQTPVKPTLEMFFGGATAPEFDNLIIPSVSSEPVSEQMIIPEKAYICQPEGNAPERPATTTGPIDLGDDWGDTWGSTEAAAEAAHYTNLNTAHNLTHTSLISREQQLEIRLQEETERIHELQTTLERCEEQKQELQLKAGKLMKKLKEYKAKIDDLQSTLNANSFRKSTSMESNSMFNDLDAAIQDELKVQITKLEAKLEEQQKLHESQVVEKEKLLKRIDVLVAGNERMSEMKERQDMDVQMYQTRIRQLQEQLNKLDDWGAESPEASNTVKQSDASNVDDAVTPTNTVTDVPVTEHLRQKIAELQAEIKDLSGDRQELQALLEDEKANGARAEETVGSLRAQISALEDAAVLHESAEKSNCYELEKKVHNLQEENSNLQEKIKSLSEQLAALKTEKEQLRQTLETNQNAAGNVESLEKEIQQLRNALSGCQQEYTELHLQLIALRTQNQELTQAREDLQSSRSVDTNNWELKLQTICNEKEQLLLQKEAIEQQLVESQNETAKLQLLPNTTALDSESQLEELNAQLQEKDSEIVHLRQRIEDLMREDQTEKLVLEILTKNQEIHMLKMQVKHLEDDKQDLEHNLSLQITKEMQAGKESAQHEVNTKLQEEVQALQQQVTALLSEKEQTEEELKVLNNHVMSSLELEDKMKATVLELDVKNIEIAELRKSIETLKVNSNGSSDIATATDAGPVDLVALNAQWEAIVEQKCGEIAQMWRNHLEQRENEFKIVETRLQEEITALRAAHPAPSDQLGHSAETSATSTTATESSTASGSTSAAISKEGTPLHTRILDESNEADTDELIRKMQISLEQQEIEIITLKEQLAIRSAEYARLAAQYDPFKLRATLSHSGVPSTNVQTTTVAASTEQKIVDDAAFVPKSELDLALYMLHQRDMRCEEMTLELLSLLDERDTLQLKLSNTLRQVESIKAQTNYMEPTVTATDAVPPDSPVKSASVAIANDASDELTQKLSQLQTVNHSKDKVIKEERDQRIRQMEKIQQDVAKMPTAAVSELVGADLSRSNQSPSTVLLNWLWGNKPHTPPIGDSMPPN